MKPGQHDIFIYPPSDYPLAIRVPVSVSHVAIGESSKELAIPNLWI